MAANIEGLDDCLSFLESAPANAMKVVKKASQAAGRKAASTLRSRIPKRWKSMVKSKVKVMDGVTNTGIGLFNGHQKQGKQTPGAEIDDWFKAYWSNYGTLTRRDRTHQFKNPVKGDSTAASKRRRNRVGQPAQNFFETARTGIESAFVEDFSRELQRNIDDFYNR